MTGDDVTVRSLRVDRVELFHDRQNALWSLRLLQISGVLELLQVGEQYLVSFSEDGGRGEWQVPLAETKHLGDAPPVFGVKKFAETAIRVDLAGKRRIIVFQGDDGQAQAAQYDMTMARLSGDLDPKAIVSGAKAMINWKQTLRKARDARREWTEILTRHSPYDST